MLKRPEKPCIECLLELNRESKKLESQYMVMAGVCTALLGGLIILLVTLMLKTGSCL